MARRTVVVEAPSGPAPRRTQVVRAGPPRRRGRLLDASLGVAGALLLVGAVVLVDALPERDVVLPQFRATAVDTVADIPSRTVNLTEQVAQVEESYEIPVDNVYNIRVVVAFRDDVRASLTDTIKAELISPDGVAVGGERILPTDRPGPPTDEQGPLVYNASLARAQWDFSVAPRPEEAILAGLREDETADEARSRLEAAAHRATAGNWTVRLTLVSAGDCPEPDDPDPMRVLACRLESSDGMDTGNGVTIEKVEYTTFSLAVEELV